MLLRFSADRRGGLRTQDVIIKYEGGGDSTKSAWERFIEDLKHGRKPSKQKRKETQNILKGDTSTTFDDSLPAFLIRNNDIWGFFEYVCHMATIDHSFLVNIKKDPVYISSFISNYGSFESLMILLNRLVREDPEKQQYGKDHQEIFNLFLNDYRNTNYDMILPLNPPGHVNGAVVYTLKDKTEVGVIKEIIVHIKEAGFGVKTGLFSIHAHLDARLEQVLDEAIRCAKHLLKEYYGPGTEPFGFNFDLEIGELSIPFDYESIGLPLTICLLSSLAGIPVDPKKAFIGNIDRDGNICNIDNLSRKLRAAQNKNVRILYVPQGRDYLIPANIKINVTTVNAIGAVLREIFPKEKLTEMFSKFNYLSKYLNSLEAVFERSGFTDPPESFTKDRLMEIIHEKRLQIGLDPESKEYGDRKQLLVYRGYILNETILLTAIANYIGKHFMEHKSIPVLVDLEEYAKPENSNNPILVYISNEISNDLNFTEREKAMFYTALEANKSHVTYFLINWQEVKVEFLLEVINTLGGEPKIFFATLGGFQESLLMYARDVQAVHLTDVIIK